MSTTRTEITDALWEAFTGAAMTRDELLATAAYAGAPIGVLAALARLSDRRFAAASELWPELPGVSNGHRS